MLFKTTFELPWDVCRGQYAVLHFFFSWGINPQPPSSREKQTFHAVQAMTAIDFKSQTDNTDQMGTNSIEQYIEQ